MYKLQEPSQVIQCREADLSVIKVAIPKAEARYKAQYDEAAPQLTIDQKHFLAKAAQTQAEEDDKDAATWCALQSMMSAAMLFSMNHACLPEFGTCCQDHCTALQSYSFLKPLLCTYASCCKNSKVELQVWV